jgi:hypothetical protein
MLGFFAWLVKNKPRKRKGRNKVFITMYYVRQIIILMVLEEITTAYLFGPSISS